MSQSHARELPPRKRAVRATPAPARSTLRCCFHGLRPPASALNKPQGLPARERMRLFRIGCLSVLVCVASGCGDDSAALNCQDPSDARRQVAACTQLIAADAKHRKAYDLRCQAYNQLE